MWPNLTVACPVCNVNKRDYASDVAPLVHPYDDDPAEHLIFLGSLQFPTIGDAKGRRTIGRLKLDRADLTRERERRLVEVNKSLEEWFRAGERDRDWLEDGIRMDASEGEFSACVKAFLVQRGFPL